MVTTILLALCIGIVSIAAAFGLFYIVDNMCMDCDGLAHALTIFALAVFLAGAIFLVCATEYGFKAVITSLCS